MRTMYSLHQSAFLILVVSVIFTWPAEGMAARLVRAKISLDGKTLLEASTGDNGRVDADGVWEYLKSIKFKPTDHFHDLKVDPDTNKTVLSSNAPRGQLSSIIVHIHHGGRAMPRQLTLVRVPVDKYGREWSLDPTQIDELFDHRLISRSQAAKLDKPQYSKRRPL